MRNLICLKVHVLLHIILLMFSFYPESRINTH